MPESRASLWQESIKSAIALSSTPADIDLINGCIDNDRRAQERLYKQFYVAMMSLCMRYTHNENDAMEVLHNGFLKVYKNIHRFDPLKASLYTWIRSIMIYSAIDFIRQNVKHSRQVEIDQATEPYVDSEAVNKLNAQELLFLVRKLPPATQTVFNLYIIEGFTHKEVGIMMGISEGTSKWHLSEARRLMRKLLKTLDAVY
ncbi:RNA polymerase sigma factor [Agriterribacter sp.]|uniref:RNA polymerase sigma factor n=1 Tax=Agriterribacter sp. TaxID=2821509 RepID=UPI002C42F408|nr:RNA polymerase sigma factor [Agriterribacter sp.]HRO44341.1 RNA polymerase sigma factor [Agriterribacter sp.]HRQ16657.1 RNA polymerase sigma factor [Agriterribacter sp.]